MAKLDCSRADKVRSSRKISITRYISICRNTDRKVGWNKRGGEGSVRRGQMVRIHRFLSENGSLLILFVVSSSSESDSDSDVAMKSSDAEDEAEQEKDRSEEEEVRDYVDSGYVAMDYKINVHRRKHLLRQARYPPSLRRKRRKRSRKQKLPKNSPKVLQNQPWRHLPPQLQCQSQK